MGMVNGLKIKKMAEQLNPSYVKSRPKLIDLIDGKQLKILDVGCATGETGKVLLEQGKAEYVEGIEYIPSMAKQAEFNLQKVITGSVEDQDTLDEISAIQFDYILLGDVLEHLVHPEQVLSYLVKNHLPPNGKVIISIPNIQHIEVFIQIFIKGDWPRNSRGIFDATHLRQFTLKNLKELMHSSGLEMIHLKRVFRFRDKQGSKFPLRSGIILRRLFPRIFTFQFITVGKKQAESD